MTDVIRPILVVFFCPGCNASYLTEQTQGPGKGRFSCSDCGRLIHEWDEQFDYQGWSRIESRREPP